MTIAVEHASSCFLPTQASGNCESALWGPETLPIPPRLLCSKLEPVRSKKTSSGYFTKHTTFVAILSAPSTATDRWHSRAKRSIECIPRAIFLLCKGKPRA